MLRATLPIKDTRRPARSKCDMGGRPHGPTHGTRQQDTGTFLQTPYAPITLCSHEGTRTRCFALSSSPNFVAIQGMMRGVKPRLRRTPPQTPLPNVLPEPGPDEALGRRLPAHPFSPC